MIASISTIGMLFTILFSIIVVGIENNNYKSLNLDNNNKVYNEEKKELDETKNQTYDYGKNFIIQVYLTESNEIKKMNLEDYVVGVVAAEMPANFESEALKAQAVAARTYAIAHMKQYGGNQCENAHGADVCDTIHCQAYITKEKRFESWPKSQCTELWNKIVNAVEQTSGEVLTYNGKLVMEPYYFAISSGKTEDAVEVFSRDIPYLKSVSSEGEEIAPKFKSEYNFTYNNFINIINKNYPKAKLNIFNIKSSIKILDLSSAGNVKNIKVGQVDISGSEFRKIFSLNSTHFSISIDNGTVKINCLGYGHDVGMSQWGANVMAKKNSKYEEILKHYYSGVEIQKIYDIYE